MNFSDKYFPVFSILTKLSELHSRLICFVLTWFCSPILQLQNSLCYRDNYRQGRYCTIMSAANFDFFSNCILILFYYSLVLVAILGLNFDVFGRYPIRNATAFFWMGFPIVMMPTWRQWIALISYPLVLNHNYWLDLESLRLWGG